MPVPDQVRDDGSGIQNPLNLLDSGFRRNDVKSEELTFCEVIKFNNRGVTPGVLKPSFVK